MILRNSLFGLAIAGIVLTLYKVESKKISHEEKAENLDECHSRNVDVVFVVPETERDDVEYLQRQSLIKIVDLLMAPGEENLTRVHVALIKLEVIKYWYEPINAKTVFKTTTYQTKTEVKSIFKNISMRDMPTDGQSFPWTESTAYSNKHVGKRFWSHSMVVMLLYNVTEDAIMRALTDSAEFSEIGDKSMESKLLVFTEQDAATFERSITFPHLAQVRQVLASDYSSLTTLDRFLCAGCPVGYFSSLDGAKCYFLRSELDLDLQWNMLVTVMCGQQGAAAIETEREYIHVKRRIEATLVIEGSMLNSPKKTNVIVHLTKDLSSFANRFHWIETFPLVYNRWLEDETSNSDAGSRRDCVVWTFQPGTNDTYGNMKAGWRHIDCNQPISRGRPLCEDRKSAHYGAAERGKLKMTPLLRANPTKYGILTSGNFVRVEKSQEGKVESEHYMPILRFLCYFMKCGHPWESMTALDSTGTETMIAINMSVSSLRHITTYQQFKSIDFSLWLFKCDQVWIPYSYVCDGKKHCADRSDEARCGALDPDSQKNVCNTSHEHACENNRCIPFSAICDMYPDCGPEDTSDETVNECGCGYFMCNDGKCRPQTYGQTDCLDFTRLGINSATGHRFPNYQRTGIASFVSDTKRYSSCAFLCNRRMCVTKDMLADGHVDCNGPEGHIDEIWGRLEAHTCRNTSRATVESWSPKCILLRDRYGEIIGCRTMEHLEGCERFVCPEGYVKCPETYCIPLFAVHDDRIDCPKGEDERGYDNYVEGDFMGMFKCDTYRYIHPELVCDGYKHCKDGSDELECDVMCRDGFLCLGSAVIPFGSDSPKTLSNFSFIHNQVRLLNLSNMEVPTFFNDYQVDSFRYLLYLILSNSAITTIKIPISKKQVYLKTNDFKTLIHLDLSRNLLTNIGAGTILGEMPFLKTLNLSYNTDLSSISFNAFDYLPTLEEIDLSWCPLTHLPRKLLHMQQGLKEFYLQGTKLQTLDLYFGPVLQHLDLQIPTLQVVNKRCFKSVRNIESIQTLSYKFCCPQILGENTDTDNCHAPMDAISSCFDLMRDPMLRVLLWLVGMTTLLGNLLVIVYRTVIHRANTTTYWIYVSHLGVSDLLMGIYLVIIASMDIRFRGEYVYHESIWRHGAGCKIAGFTSTWSSETSAMFIFLITLDRFLFVKFPLGEVRLTKRNIHITCLIAWVIGFIIAVIPLLPPLKHWSIYSTNGMCLGLPLSVQRPAGWHYPATIFVGFNFILFLLIAVGQMAIFRSYYTNTSANIRSSEAASRKRQKEIRLAKRLALIVVSDFLCWFPIGIMGLLAISGREIGNEVYAWSAVVVLPINSALNPLLYTWGTIKDKYDKWREGKPSNATHVKGQQPRGKPKEIATCFMTSDKATNTSDEDTDKEHIGVMTSDEDTDTRHISVMTSDGDTPMSDSSTTTCDGATESSYL